MGTSEDRVLQSLSEILGQLREIRLRFEAEQLDTLLRLRAIIDEIRKDVDGNANGG